LKSIPIASASVAPQTGNWQKRRNLPRKVLISLKTGIRLALLQPKWSNKGFGGGIIAILKGAPDLTSGDFEFI